MDLLVRQTSNLWDVTERRETHVVEEPYDADTEQPEPVVSNYQPIGSLLLHGFFGELLRLLEAKPQDEQDQWEHQANTQTHAPNNAVMATMSGGGHNICSETVSTRLYK